MTDSPRLPPLRTNVPVVVLNTHHSGLAIARDLAPFGVKVFGVTAMAGFAGNASKCLTYRPAPDSFEQPDELRDFLRQLRGECSDRPLLLPTRDHDINFIAKHRDELEPHYRIAQVPTATLDTVMNKDALAAVALEVGIDVPRSVTISEPAMLERARELRFPCICKPLYASQWRRPGIWEAVGRQKALRLDRFDDLSRFYRGFAHLDPLVNVQEWVEGGEECLQIFGSYVTADHDVAAFFTARKRLQYPALAGTGIVVEALPLPDLDEPSRRLLRALRFRGICEIEYKRDARTGRLYLIEVNPRHWDQHGLGTAVGVNLSEALYRDMTDQAARPMLQAAERARWLADGEYARHLARCLLGRAPLRDAALAFGTRRTWAVFKADDLGPALAMLGVRSAASRE